MNSSYLVGYYGMKNTGDDALLAASAWGAKKFLGSDTLIVNSPTTINIPYHGQEKPLLVETQKFPGQNRLKQYKAAFRADNIIFGGGSVLQNQHDINLKQDLLTLTGRYNNNAIGIGIGPFNDIKAEKSCARLLNSCDFIGVRDEISLDIAHDIAPQANVKLTFDLAPSLLSMTHNNYSAIERRGIAVCLCPHERLKNQPAAESNRIKEIAEALRKTHLLTGEPIVFVDFNGHKHLGDEAVHKETAMLMREIPHEFIKYDPNPFNVLQRMSSFKIILSMRLHASIFGFLANTPVISMNYHQKCEAWCKQIGIPESLYFSTQDTERNELTEKLYNGLVYGFKNCSMAISTACKLSMKNWSMINE